MYSVSVLKRTVLNCVSNNLCGVKFLMTKKILTKKMLTKKYWDILENLFQVYGNPVETLSECGQLRVLMWFHILPSQSPESLHGESACTR